MKRSRGVATSFARETGKEMSTEEIRWKRSYSRREKKKNKLEAGRVFRARVEPELKEWKFRMDSTRRSWRREMCGWGKGRRKGGQGSCFEGKGHREEEKTRDGDRV